MSKETFSGDGTGKWVKRRAGQHALKEGRRRVALWGLAGAVASTFKLSNFEKHAKHRVSEANRTWVVGGEAEVAVAAMLEGLREHGFYIYHDVPISGIGNVDHVAIGPSGVFAIETKSHRGKVSAHGQGLLLNDRTTDKDFISQAWSGAYRLKEITHVEVVPIICFTRAFVEGRVYVRGLNVVPLKWLNEMILSNVPGAGRLDFLVISKAVSAVGAATGTFPSAVPKRKDP